MKELSLLIDLPGLQQRQGRSPASGELVEQDRQEYEMYLEYKEYNNYGM